VEKHVEPVLLAKAVYQDKVNLLFSVSSTGVAVCWFVVSVALSVGVYVCLCVSVCLAKAFYQDKVNLLFSASDACMIRRPN
jgi:hypothetical protein